MGSKPGTVAQPSALTHRTQTPEGIMKGIIAWLLGVPLIVIIGLYAFHIF